MNILTHSNPIHTYYSNLLPLPHINSTTLFKSLSGSSNSLKWVSKSHKKFQSLVHSRSNLGFCTMIKRVSEESFGAKNGDDLIRVRCGAIESISSEEEEEGDKDDGYYMRKALELARRGMGCTSPNPMVGCVIVKDGLIVGQGFHPKAGDPHAEVFALRDAGELAENATAYVTLEPCNHYGKTPPCTEALIKAKLKKVIVGTVDPNPIVSSRGVKRLREAGIEVSVGVEEDSCKKLIEAFVHTKLYGKPFVAIRYSMSVDGRLSSQLGEKATERGGYYSQLLQEYDAVVHAPTSTTQQFAFLPSQEPNACQPLQILIAKDDSSLSDILLQRAGRDCRTIVFSNKELTLGSQLSQKGIENVVMDQSSLDAILDYCGRQGFCNVLVDLSGEIDVLQEILTEGLRKNLIQKVVVEIVPFWTADGGVSPLPVMHLAQKKLLRSLSPRISGNNVLLEGYFDH